MPKILVCQHVPYEILGTLNPFLKSAGFRIRYVNFGRHPDARPSLEGYHGLVILGGPMGVGDVRAHPHLLTESALVREALARDLPILGICLGAQLIAHALGAAVRRNPVKEIGWLPITLTPAGRRDPLLGHFGPREQVFHWHGDTFGIPPGAVRLAASEGCANQAFRYRDRVYGLQFHLEVDEAMIERWLKVPAFQRELEEVDGALSPERIRRDTARYLERLRVLSSRTFAAFVELFGERRKHQFLPSR